MLSRRIILLISAAFLTQGSSPAFAASRTNPVKMLDTDDDGTLDLAPKCRRPLRPSSLRLDRDHDGTLDRRELTDRLDAPSLRPPNRP